MGAVRRRVPTADKTFDGLRVKFEQIFILGELFLPKYTKSDSKDIYNVTVVQFLLEIYINAVLLYKC